MNRLIVYCICTLTLLTCYCLDVHADTVLPVAADSATMHEAKTLLTRLDEINTMDKSALNSRELKKLRKEVRSIKGDLKELDGGQYVLIGRLVILLFIPLVVFNLSQ
jgi:hypothetical protein